MRKKCSVLIKLYASQQFPHKSHLAFVQHTAAISLRNSFDINDAKTIVAMQDMT
jgi:hypothetical protein